MMLIYLLLNIIVMMISQESKSIPFAIRNRIAKQSDCMDSSLYSGCGGACAKGNQIISRSKGEYSGAL